LVLPWLHVKGLASKILAYSARQVSIVDFGAVHEVLQTAMGWQDGHMHEFSVGQRRFGRPDPQARLMGLPPVENERTVRLSSLLSRTSSKVIYT
jgi:hypothetical protein